MKNIISGKHVIFAVTFICLTLSFQAQAYRQFTATKVKELRAYQSGKGYVVFMDVPTIPESETTDCTTIPSANNKALAFNATTDGGKAIMAALSAAQMADRPVTVFGNGACTSISNVEEMNYMKIE